MSDNNKNKNSKNNIDSSKNNKNNNIKDDFVSAVLYM